MLDEPGCRSREERLPTVAHLDDPGAVMNGVPDVRPAAHERLARVQPQAHADGAAARPRFRGDGDLDVGRGRHRRRCALEHREEPVAEVLHLDTAVCAERRAEQLVVAIEDLRVAHRPELLQAHRGALDVGEQEGDCAARQLCHEEPRRRRDLRRPSRGSDGTPAGGGSRWGNPCFPAGPLTSTSG